MFEPDFPGLVDEVRAAYKPHFAEVTRRAARRRVRARTARVAAVAVALGAAGLVTGTGHAPTPPGGDPDHHGPSPVSATPALVDMEPSFVAGDLNHLYAAYLAHPCTGADCVVMLAASADRGTTWRRSPMPVLRDRSFFDLTALSPTTLLARYVAGPAGAGQVTGDGYEASTDAGRTWHWVDVRVTDSIPTGWQPLDSTATSVLDMTVTAASPATGAVVRLSPGVPNHTFDAGSFDTRESTDTGLWITGLLVPPVAEGATTNLTEQDLLKDGKGNPLQGIGTVSVSHDGGRTWDTHTFAGTDTEDQGLPVTPLFATYDGHTAYVLLPKDGAEVVYRSTDGGATWTARGTVDTGSDTTKFALLTVRPDGTLVALLVGPTPVAYGSTDGGLSFHRLADSHPDAVPVPGGYAEQAPAGPADPSGIVLWLSPDRVHWTRVAFPNP